MPRFLQQVRDCVKYGISDSMMKRLHYTDLQCLLIQYRIAEFKEFIASKKQEEAQRQGIHHIKPMSTEDIRKWSKG
jgi:hypothetical protein